MTSDSAFTRDRALTRAEIFDAQDHVVERVDVPEWGGFVLVQSITGEERDAFEAAFIVKRGQNRDLNYRNMRAQLVARAVCDAGGARVFDDNDVAVLGRKSARALDRVYAVAARLSGLRKEDEVELVEDFEHTPVAASPSA